MHQPDNISVWLKKVLFLRAHLFVQGQYARVRMYVISTAEGCELFKLELLTSGREYGEEFEIFWLIPFILFIFLSSGGWRKVKLNPFTTGNPFGGQNNLGRGSGALKGLSSPHLVFHVFLYASCVDLTQLLAQPNASWRTLRIPLK